MDGQAEAIVSPRTFCPPAGTKGSPQMSRQAPFGGMDIMTSRTSWNAQLVIRWLAIAFCLIFWAALVIFIW
ncbi:hypothetical protein ATY30_16450 [Sinorhizobium americanum]|uniref:Uncharacterized protein n=1 Tax=Rhizobium fredii TaxID=380 RepID=A0A2L0HF71_RHIFR|nr:hypothetical protein NXT3_PC00958 [Sinorhizobium fredii]PDT53048.1 hypothetical protein CO664_11975 [Sinorhizobium sp. NG07B]POH29215.1 hypothetical protein ATY30_16450 [Sinorhizobium americanum]